jgi:hypothetical protein
MTNSSSGASFHGLYKVFSIFFFRFKFMALGNDFFIRHKGLSPVNQPCTNTEESYSHSHAEA